MVQSHAYSAIESESTSGPRLVFAALIFNLVLCLITTRGGIHMSNAIVAVAELLIMSIGLLTIRHRITPRVVQVMGMIAVFLVGMKLLNPGLDLKIVHDLGIMYVFYELGMMSTQQTANRLVWLVMMIVVAFGLFELILPNIYVTFFDIWTYYIDKGVISASTINYSNTGFFVSGDRAGQLSRTFFPSLLGAHRVSSVFLEPVSMGNFSVIIFAWCLSTRLDLSFKKLFLYGLAAFCFVLGDSRFASGCWMLMLLLRMTPLYRSSFIVICMPLAAVLGLVFAGSIHALPGVSPSIMEDDFGGRLLFSGRLLDYWQPEQWFALAPSQVYTADTGYAYVINNLSLPLALFCLAIFAFNRPRTDEAASMKAMIAVYMATSLCIGANMFTIKTAGLMWFLYGAANVLPGAGALPSFLRLRGSAGFALPALAGDVRSSARES
jgi:putative polymerase